jgi:hypothetical protein
VIKNLSRVQELYSAAYFDGFLVTVDPGGSSLTFNSGKTNTASFQKLAFVLGFSEPLKQAVASTNAMMGLRTWSERGMKMSWAYHPENGITFSIQLDETRPIPADAGNYCWQCLSPRDQKPEYCPNCHTINIQLAKAVMDKVMERDAKQREAMEAIKAQNKKTLPWTCLGSLVVVGGILYGIYWILGHLVYHLF